MESLYKSISLQEKAKHLIGQIFWIPAFISMPRLYVVRLGNWDRATPIREAAFTLKSETLNALGKDSELYHHMPISELKLTSGEELLVKKVKRRPGLLIIREGLNTRTLANHTAGRGPKPNPNEHVFAPIVSLRKEDNIGHDYPDVFIKAVKNDDIPELLYLPPNGTTLKNESMAILSALQPHPINTIEATEHCVDPLQLATKLDLFFEDIGNQLLS